MLRAAAGLICMMLAAAIGSAPLAAQTVGVVQSEILVLDTERLFNETKLGQRLTREYQAEREKLAARNRKLEAELEAEEKDLTARRDETSPQEFRDLADAFDEKVRKLRRDSDRAVRDLERKRERGPLVFMRTVEPVLIDLMRDAGGTVVLDKRGVLLHADVIDITDAAIARIDDAIGAGGEPPDDGDE